MMYSHAAFPLILLFMLVGPVLVVVLIALVVWAVTRSTHQVVPAASYPASAPPQSPIDILQRRFASGEISADEYQKARDLLKGEQPPAS